MQPPITATECLARNEAYWKDQELSLALLEQKMRNAFLQAVVERLAAILERHDALGPTTATERHRT
jgi:hypothetical protein